MRSYMGTAAQSKGVAKLSRRKNAGIEVVGKLGGNFSWEYRINVNRSSSMQLQATFMNKNH